MILLKRSVFNAAMDTFRVNDFRVYRRTEGGTWQIELTRTQRYSLKTKDRDQAKERAKAIIGKYLLGKIQSLKAYKNLKISACLEQFLKDKDWAHFEKVGILTIHEYSEKDKLFNKFHRPDL